VSKPVVDLRGADRDAKLLREWLTESIQPFQYFSFVGISDDGTSDTQVAQLISKPSNLIQISTYDTNTTKDRMTWAMLPYDIWRRRELGDAPQSMDVFNVGGVLNVDLVSVMGGDPQARRSVQLWETSNPEFFLEGCLHLVKPRPAKPDSLVHHKAHPILSLHDTLATEHMEVDRKLQHSARTGLFYDLHGKYNRQYLQCVLCQQWLREKKGNWYFLHGCPNHITLLFFSDQEALQMA
jgi:hypothetical protein